jgi:hypothetical protein
MHFRLDCQLPHKNEGRERRFDDLWRFLAMDICNDSFEFLCIAFIAYFLYCIQFRGFGWVKKKEW